MKKECKFNLLGNIVILVFIFFLLVFLDFQFISGALYNQANQTEFDLGTYTDTGYSSGAVSLSSGKTQGNYTSKVFGTGAASRWNNLTFQSVIQSQESLFSVDTTSDVWKSINLGITWNLTKDDYNGGNPNGATDMARNSLGNLFIVDNQDLWKSTDSGVTWSLVNDDYNGAGDSHSAYVLNIDSNNYIYIIDGGQEVFKSTDSGTTFSKVSDDFNGANGNIFGVSIDSSNYIYAVDAQSDVWKSINLGITWNLTKDDYNGGNPNGATDMARNSLGNLFIVDNQDLWKSTDSGVTWSLVNDDYNGAGDSHSAYVLDIDSNNYIYIIDGGQEVFKSTDLGTTFSKVSADFNGGSGNIFGLVSFNYSTNLSFQVRNCSLSNCSDGIWRSNTINNINLTGKYFQYKVNFNSEDVSITPKLNNVSIDYSLLNSLPSVSSPVILPETAYKNDNLTCSFTASDSDAGDSLSVNYTWYKNNIVFLRGTLSVANNIQSSVVLNNGNTSKGEIWNCSIIPYDGTEYGTEKTIGKLISNSLPTQPTVDIIPGIPSDDDDLTASIINSSSDLDEDDITYTYKWYKNNVLQAGLTTNIIGKALTSNGDAWRVNVSAYDGTGYSVSGTDIVSIGLDIIFPYWNPIPSNQTVDYRSNFIYQVSAQDNVGIFGYFINDNINFNINSSSGIITNNTALILGNNYSLTIYVNDTSGNENSSVIIISINIDNSAPNITLGVPANGESLDSGTNAITISFSTNENASCRYSLLNNTWENMSEIDNTNSTSHSFIVNSLSNGQTYTYYFLCEDFYGNRMNTNEILRFSVAAVPSNSNSGDNSGQGGGGGGKGIVSYQCSDKKDNDGDGLIDLNDPGCASSVDNDEFNSIENSENWKCTEWTECSVEGVQVRACTSQSNNTNILNKPLEIRECKRPTCGDGIQNQGELGVDCGGPCANRCEKSDITGKATEFISPDEKFNMVYGAGILVFLILFIGILVFISKLEKKLKKEKIKDKNQLKKLKFKIIIAHIIHILIIVATFILLYLLFFK